MKLQLEQLDLLKPWPTFTLRSGCHALRVLVRIGDIPVGEVMSRAVRSGQITPRRLRKRIAAKLGYGIFTALSQRAAAAGPDVLSRLSAETSSPLLKINYSTMSGHVMRRQIERHLLLETGLPAPWPALLAQAQQNAPSFELPPVTVIVCTRDRAAHLEGCLESLLKLDYPRFDILVVDNSKHCAATQELCQRFNVNYIREERPGLSIARNTALSAARTRWVAFTDDDCRPEPNWLRELARKLQGTNCRCVTGLVLPATLDNSAEIAFEIYGGLGRGFTDVAYAPRFIKQKRWKPAETWNIGAGANMLLDAELARKLGGYDIDLGAGSTCPCSEDTLLWYQMLRAGHSIHYTPRAIVHHHHRSTPESLRRQIHNYAIGHAAYHIRCAANFGDYRSILHLIYHLPKWFWKNYRQAARGKTKYPRSLIPLEAVGTIKGVWRYSFAKLRRMMTRSDEQSQSSRHPAMITTAPIASPKAACTSGEPVAEPRTEASNHVVKYESYEPPVRAA